MTNLQQLICLVAENPDLKDSFLNDLLQNMSFGEFTDVNEDPDLFCEKVIGKMNDLDKALNNLCDRYVQNESRLTSQFFRAKIHNSEIEPNKKKRMMTELCKTRNRFKIADNFRWASIYDRFGQFKESGYSGFGVRSGYQVVLLLDYHDRHTYRDCGNLLIKNQLQKKNNG